MAKPRRAQHAHTSHRFDSPRQLDARTEERQALLDEALAGSADAHGALLASYRTQMRRYFAARLSPALRQKADEDDLTPTACIHALRCFTRFTRCKLASYWAWLRQICENVVRRLARWCCEDKRDLRREELLGQLRLEDGSQHPYHRQQPTAEAILAGFEMAGQLHAALDQLPDDELRIVGLRFTEGLTLSQVADRIGLSIDAVKRASQRGVSRLKWRLGNV